MLAPRDRRVDVSRESQLTLTYVTTSYRVLQLLLRKPKMLAAPEAIADISRRRRAAAAGRRRRNAGTASAAAGGSAAARPLVSNVRNTRTRAIGGILIKNPLRASN